MSQRGHLSIPVVNTTTAMFVAVGASPANITTTMGSVSTIPGVEMWLLSVTQAAWFAQGANPTASAGAGSTLINPNYPVLLDATFGAHVSIIQDSVAGKASLTRVMLMNR